MSQSQSTNAFLEFLTSLSWVPAFLSALASMATIYAVWIARKALNSWREQSHANRKAEAAISLLAAANEIQTRLGSARLGLSDNEDKSYKGREREINEISYQSLYQARNLLKALDEKVDIAQHVIALDRARFKLLRLLGLMEIATVQGDVGKFGEHLSAFTSFGEGDEIYDQISGAISGLESELFPLIRLK